MLLQYLKTLSATSIGDEMSCWSSYLSQHGSCCCLSCTWLWICAAAVSSRLSAAPTTSPSVQLTQPTTSLSVQLTQPTTSLSVQLTQPTSLSAADTTYNITECSWHNLQHHLSAADTPYTSTDFTWLRASTRVHTQGSDRIEILLLSDIHPSRNRSSRDEIFNIFTV